MTSTISDQPADGQTTKTAGRFVIDIPPDRVAEALRPVLGVPLLTRAVKSARKAGYAEGVVRVPTSSAPDSIGELARTLDIGVAEEWPTKGGYPTLVLSLDVLPEKEWLGEIASLPVAKGQILSPRDGIWSIGPDTAVRAYAGDASPVTLETGPILSLKSPADIKAAEDRLMVRLGKDTDGFMSRHFARPISMAVSRRVAPYPVSPNQMTVVSMLLGLAGAPFFLSSVWWLQAIGGLLFVAHSVIDGCDGELARLKFAESRWGGLLDFWSDNIVHIAVFGCMAAGWALAAGHWWPLAVGAAAVIGAGGSAIAVYWFTLREKKTAGPVYTSVSGGPASRASKMLDDLSRRDFIYLVFALALFGQAHWFLALTAIGAPVFLVAVLVVVSRARQPVS